jgi:hypothetical protein
MITTIKTLKSLKKVVYGFVMQFFFMRVREEHKQVVKKLKVKAFLEEYKLVFVEHKNTFHLLKSLIIRFLLYLKPNHLILGFIRAHLCTIKI